MRFKYIFKNSNSIHSSWISRTYHSTNNKNTSKILYNKIINSWHIPTGIFIIAALQLRHSLKEKEMISNNKNDSKLNHIRDKNISMEQKEEDKNNFILMKMISYRIVSRIWGFIHGITLPESLRAPLYKLWTYTFSCNLEEIKYPLEHYKNLGEFFSRSLKENARSFGTNKYSLFSPTDGRIATFGAIDELKNRNTTSYRLEQIKGVTYRLDEFLGLSTVDMKDPKSNNLYFAVIYLAPGDYHRIHSPMEIDLIERRHFPGYLYPVNTKVSRLIPKLFCLNERVALLGQWREGLFFSLIAVGATNVGSIYLTHEPEFRTNVTGHGKYIGKYFRKIYEKSLKIIRGEEIAQFRLGSTVVLVFEAPKDFKFTIKEGEKIYLGQTIGECKSWKF